jgi:hypothetical protein
MFVVWPATVLALVAALHLLTGGLQIRVTAADDYRQIHVQLDVVPETRTLSRDCGAGDVKRGGCRPGQSIAAGEPPNVKSLALIAYLVGVWLAAERWCKRRWPDRLQSE